MNKLSRREDRRDQKKTTTNKRGTGNRENGTVNGEGEQKTSYDFFRPFLRFSSSFQFPSSRILFEVGVSDRFRLLFEAVEVFEVVALVVPSNGANLELRLTNKRKRNRPK